MSLPSPEVCEQARLSRDPRFDGRFYIGVLTTGIYCRTICPARMPDAGNVRFFPSAAAAVDAGFRPCLRCRPERAGSAPEWLLGSDTVVRALRLIESGYLDAHSTEALAGEFGMTGRHLSRLFHDALGTTPAGFARHQRVQLAKRLIDEGSVTLTDVAHLAGFGSVRAFNAAIQRVYGCAPRTLRRKRGVPERADRLTLSLTLRQPVDLQWLFGFFSKRSLPGLEEAVGHSYRRRVGLRTGGSDWLVVTDMQHHLRVEIPTDIKMPVAEVVARIQRMFDLGADSQVIDAHLGRCAHIGDFVRSTPGIRVPGVWDGFETGVRALLGQQVSVARARDLAEALMERFGDGDFPDPAALVDADVAALGMPGARGAAVRALSRAVAEGVLCLDHTANAVRVAEQLLGIPGIGPWTAGYIGMRVLKDPDAFIASDWVLKRDLARSASAITKLAERWRPWRAYGAMVVWHAASGPVRVNPDIKGGQTNECNTRSA